MSSSIKNNYKKSLKKNYKKHLLLSKLPATFRFFNYTGTSNNAVSIYDLMVLELNNALNKIQSNVPTNVNTVRILVTYADGNVCFDSKALLNNTFANFQNNTINSSNYNTRLIFQKANIDLYNENYYYELKNTFNATKSNIVNEYRILKHYKSDKTQGYVALSYEFN